MQMLKIVFPLIMSISILLGNNLLQLKNGKIVDIKNQVINLKGCNTGNWLMLEMWMLSYADKGIADQYEFIKTLEIGLENIKLKN